MKELAIEKYVPLAKARNAAIIGLELEFTHKNEYIDEERILECAGVDHIYDDGGVDDRNGYHYSSEIVTHPLIYDKSIETFNKVTDFISEKGKTIKDSSCHINVSFKDSDLIPNWYDFWAPSAEYQDWGYHNNDEELNPFKALSFAMPLTGIHRYLNRGLHNMWCNHHLDEVLTNIRCSEELPTSKRILKNFEYDRSMTALRPDRIEFRIGGGKGYNTEIGRKKLKRVIDICCQYMFASIHNPELIRYLANININKALSVLKGNQKMTGFSSSTMWRWRNGYVQ